MARRNSPSEFIWASRYGMNAASPPFRHIDWNPSRSSLSQAISADAESNSDNASYCICPNCAQPELLSTGTAELVRLHRGDIASPRIVDIGADYDDCDRTLPHTHHAPLVPSMARVADLLTPAASNHAHAAHPLPAFPRGDVGPIGLGITGELAESIYTCDDLGETSTTTSSSSPGYTGPAAYADGHYNTLRRSPGSFDDGTSPSDTQDLAPLPSAARRIHDICLAASQAFLRAHAADYALRHASTRQCRRHSPYARYTTCRYSARDHGHSVSVSVSLCDYHRHRYHQRLRHSRYSPTDSLLHNAGAICSVLWARARREQRGSAVVGAQQREAAEDMERVMRRAERIFAEWRMEEGDEGVERDYELWDEEEESIFRVGEDFCDALGDQEAAGEAWDVQNEEGSVWFGGDAEEEYEEEAPLEWDD